jgi:tripartite ATP-independent transporter DctM subunit
MLWLMLLVFLVLLVSGLPIAMSIILACFTYLFTGGNMPLQVVPQRMIVGVDTFTFLAIPFFFLMGEIMNHGGLTQRMVRWAQCLVGSVRGGLTYVTIIVNMILAGMSGSAIADASATGTVLIPALEKAGYQKKFAAALVASASCIGPIIPPSIGFIIYATLANVSVGKMFLAGAIPGVLMGLMLMGMSFIISMRRSYPKSDRSSLKELINASKDVSLVLIIPVIIIGGVLLGITTITESAVVATIYSLILAGVVYREITLKDLKEILYKTGVDTAAVVIIIATASAFGWILGREQVPQHLALYVQSFIHSPSTFFLVFIAIMLPLGCVIEDTALLIILAPILAPVAVSVGIDPILFGVVFVLTMMLCLLTPPMGVTLFVVSRVTGLRIEEFVLEILPFFLVILLLTIIVAFVPPLSLWLPSLMN